MGRVVVVVGGARGLGLACADAFAAQGDEVVATHRGTPAPRHHDVTCDVRDREQVDAAFTEVEARFGPPEVVVVSAGIATVELMARQHADTLQDVIDTNVLGAFHVVQRAVLVMSPLRRGAIVLVGSAAAHHGAAGMAAYAASKAALVGLARSTAREVGRRGVTVNVVVPGLLENLVQGVPGGDDWVTTTPLGRAGRLDEAAAVVRHLASPAAGFTTGAVVPVDGGHSMGA